MKRLLTVKEVDAIAKAGKPGRYAVGRGLYLQIAVGGTRTWIYRYMRDGRARHMGFGSFDRGISLAKARQKAEEAYNLLADGIDPIDAKQARKHQASLNAAKAITFRRCAERYIKAHQLGWENEKHRKQWPASLEAYAYPVFGNLAVADVDTGLVLRALETIWATKPETATRVRGRIESILDWARVRGYREGENPARWRGHLDKLLPARRKVMRVEHHAALPFADVPAFMEALRAQDGISERALEFLILTAARTGEVFGARWSEIDFENKVWTVPAGRMKARNAHRVPLASRAIALLEAMPRVAGSDHVFPGARYGQPLSKMALGRVLGRMGRDDITVHGFRSSFRDWAAETTGYPGEMLEMALAHAVSNKVEGAYRRGDMFDKRRRLMADWAAYCESEPVERGTVVVMRERANG